MSSRIITIGGTILLYSLFLSSCATTGPVVLPEEAGRFLAVLNSSEYLPDNFKGTGMLTISRENKIQTMRIAWMGARPDKLKFQAVDPWGNPVFRFFLDNGIFYLWSARQNAYYKGKGTTKNLKRILSVPVDGGGLVDIFSGRPPIISFRRAAVGQATEEDGRILLLYRWGNRISEKVWFNREETLADHAAFFDGWGNLTYSVLFNAFEKVDGKFFPNEIKILYGADNSIVLRMDRLWPGVEAPANAFTPDLSHAKVFNLDS